MDARNDRDLAPAALRLEVEALNADYAECLDRGDYERWPQFFTDPCVYKIVARDNHERGLPLAIWLCESRGMLEDRVIAIRRTSVFGPRYMRHIVSGTVLKGWEADDLRAEANYLVLETLPDEPTRVFNTGRYFDRLRFDGEGQLRLRERLCVFDSLLVPNSLIFPI